MKVNQNRRSFLVFNFPICLCNYHLKGFSASSHFQSHNHTITSWPMEIAQKTAQVDKINSRNLTTPGNGSFVRTPFASHFSITFLPRYLTHSRLFLSYLSPLFDKSRFSLIWKMFCFILCQINSFPNDAVIISFLCFLETICPKCLKGENFKTFTLYWTFQL